MLPTTTAINHKYVYRWILISGLYVDLNFLLNFFLPEFFQTPTPTSKKDAPGGVVQLSTVSPSLLHQLSFFYFPFLFPLPFSFFSFSFSLPHHILLYFIPLNSFSILNLYSSLFYSFHSLLYQSYLYLIFS